MSWDKIVLDNVDARSGLVRRIDALFSHQRSHWNIFRQGEAALGSIRTRELRYRGGYVVVQANPGRRASTHARVDSRSIAARPCFLCPANIPAGERGIAWDDFVILPNPFPVLRRHCTIPLRAHRPQRLAGLERALLKLARAIGPEMLVFYNGPQCGASAPDHVHFQACDADMVPLLQEVPCDRKGPWCRPYASFGRRLIVLHGQRSDLLAEEIIRMMEQLRRAAATVDEPMINLLVHFRENGYRVLLFPRASHRPTCYFADAASRIAVSPAALEMAGILVVAEPGHFERIDAIGARKIYEEVSLDPTRFKQLVETLD